MAQKDKQTHTQTHGHGDSKTNSAKRAELVKRTFESRGLAERHKGIYKEEEQVNIVSTIGNCLICRMYILLPYDHATNLFTPKHRLTMI